jgi:hypothetical protein
MALQKTLSIKGVTIPNAYIRVGKFSGTKERYTFQVGISASADEQPFDTQEHSCEVDLNGGNIVQQAYLYLKSTSAFVNALDC